MIEGVLRHCTSMSVDRNYVDSHGVSEVAFAFTHLLGFRLMPRLKRISTQRLYRGPGREPGVYPNGRRVGHAAPAAAGVAGALVDQESAAWMTVVLMLLGIGWNLGVVGGSMLLAASVSPSLRPHAEGLGEVAMGLAAGAGAPIAGLIVALGSLTVLLLAGAATAALTFAFVRLKIRNT